MVTLESEPSARAQCCASVAVLRLTHELWAVVIVRRGVSARAIFIRNIANEPRAAWDCSSS